MALALRRYRKTLLASGLIDGAELRAVELAVPARQRPATPEALAQALIQAEKLTPFQAEEIAAGRATGLVLGNYVLLERIGAGGMGQVFKAWHRRMHRVVALKTLPNQATAGENSLARFRREILAAAQLSHPNIVTAFDADVSAGVHFLVMEYVAGQNLADVLRCRGPLAVAQAVKYLLDAARGLAYAHSQGIVHRDVKPSNLIVDALDVVKVLDLGLARPAAMSESELTMPGDVVGTLEYMAPEQAAALPSVDGRADVYGLGCTLYRLVTGQLPYRGRSPAELIAAHREQTIPSLRALRDDAPRSLDTMFKRMVAKQPADRYQTMQEVIDALERVRGARPKSGRSADFGLSKIEADKETSGQADKEKASGSISLDLCPGPTLSGGAAEEQQAPMRAAVSPAVALVALLAALAGMLSLSWFDTGRDKGETGTASTSGISKASDWQRSWAESLGIPVTLTNSLGMRFVLIPPEGLERPGTIRTPFYCAVYEVTVGQYRQYQAARGQGVVSGAAFRAGQSERHPAVDFTPADAEMFCLWLSQRDGANYRLPTAAELAHACRAGANDRLWFDVDRLDVGRFAWYAITASGRTHQVGLLEANPLGLHDVLGNAPEWCRAAPGEMAGDPSSSPTSYELYGGSWLSPATGLGAVEKPGGKFGGLRLVLELPLEARWSE